MCLSCGGEAHASKSCEEAADQGLVELGRSLGWKTCPFCSKMVERTEGCNSMTCRHLGCEKTFCYGCAKSPCQC
jgi:hypothetical protein